MVKFYIGELKFLDFHGKGITYTKENKKIYEGYFVNNKYEGKGTLYFEENYLKGNFIEGKCHGKGTLYSKDNSIIYEGDYAFGLFEGNGKKYEKNGEYYIGQFINNQKFWKGKNIL